MSYRADKLGDGRTDGRTDAGNDNTRRPILASGKNCLIQNNFWMTSTTNPPTQPPHKFTDPSFDQRDDVIKWKHFPCCWPFVQGIHRSLKQFLPFVKSLHIFIRFWIPYSCLQVEINKSGSHFSSSGFWWSVYTAFWSKASAIGREPQQITIESW